MTIEQLIIKDLAAKTKIKLASKGVTDIVLVSNPLKEIVVDENGHKKQKLEMNTVMFKKLAVDDMDKEEYLDLWHLEKRYNALNFKLTQKARNIFMDLDFVYEIENGMYKPVIRMIDDMLNLTCNLGDASEIVLSGTVNMTKSKVDVTIPEIIIGGVSWQPELKAQVKTSCTRGAGYSNSNIF